MGLIEWMAGRSASTKFTPEDNREMPKNEDEPHKQRLNRHDNKYSSTTTCQSSNQLSGSTSNSHGQDGSQRNLIKQLRDHNRMLQKQLDELEDDAVGLEDEVKDVEKENSALKQQLDEARKALGTADNDIKTQLKTIATHAQEMKQKDKELSEYRQQNLEQQKTIDRVRARYEDAITSEKYQVLQSQADEMLAYIHWQDQRWVKSQNHAENLVGLLKDQEKQIKMAQQDVFQAKNQMGWTTEPDPVIGAALTSLERLIKRFSKKYAAMLTDEYHLLAILPSKYVDLENILARGGYAALVEPQCRKAAPHLLLSAWLSRVIFDKVFQDPFYFVRELLCQYSGQTPQQGQDTIKDLFKLIEQRHGLNSKEYANFRSDTFRLLYRPGNALKESEAAHFDEKLSHAKSMVNLTLAEIIACNAGFMIKEPRHGEVFTALEEIISKAGEISSHLSTQRSGLACKGIRELPEYFQSSSNLMEAHVLHHMELEDNERSLDGRKILLVTQPAVIAIGASDGSDPSVRRILRKAVVWLGKPAQETVRATAAKDESIRDATGRMAGVYIDLSKDE